MHRRQWALISGCMLLAVTLGLAGCTVEVGRRGVGDLSLADSSAGGNDPHSMDLSGAPDADNIFEASHPSGDQGSGNPGLEAGLGSPDTQAPCPAGFKQKNGGCVDINECASSPCKAGEACTNTPGSYQCDPIDCTLWDFASNTPCATGTYNCDCASGCGATTPCSTSTPDAGTGPTDCTTWDYAANSSCPAGTYNCDCAGPCGSTTPCATVPPGWPPTSYIEIGDYHGRFNGDRPTWYFSKNMSDYPSSFDVVLYGCLMITVTSNDGLRFESGGVIVKQSDVAGRGMAVVGPSSCQSDKCYIQ